MDSVWAIHRRHIVDLSMARRRVLRPTPAQPPTAIAAKYAARYVLHVSHLLHRFVHAYADLKRRTDAEAPIVRSFQDLLVHFGNAFVLDLTPISDGMISETSTYSKDVVDKIHKQVLGVAMTDGPKIAAAIEAHRVKNAALIKAMSIEHMQRIKQLVDEHQGQDVGLLAKALQVEIGVGASRARLIARDQTLKINGQLTQERHKEAGISKYEWVTSSDERVRSTHAKLNGQTFEWDKPPMVAPGRHENPGQDYQCRCIANPVIDLDELEAKAAPEPVAPVAPVKAAKPKADPNAWHNKHHLTWTPEEWAKYNKLKGAKWAAYSANRKAAGLDVEVTHPSKPVPVVPPVAEKAPEPPKVAPPVETPKKGLSPAEKMAIIKALTMAEQVQYSVLDFDGQVAYLENKAFQAAQPKVDPWAKLAAKPVETPKAASSTYTPPKGVEHSPPPSPNKEVVGFKKIEAKPPSGAPAWFAKDMADFTPAELKAYKSSGVDTRKSYSEYRYNLATSTSSSTRDEAKRPQPNKGVDMTSMPINKQVDGLDFGEHAMDVGVHYPHNGMTADNGIPAVKKATSRATPNMGPRELESLQKYTGSEYKQMNLYLRDPVAFVAQYGNASADYYADLVNKAQRALSHMPKPDDKVVLFRGLSVSSKAELEAIVGDDQWVSKSFLSTSRDLGLAANFGGPGYKIILRFHKHHSGSMVEAVSRSEYECETLFPPGATFNVVGRQRISDKMFLIDMEEVVK